jgi:hypothetical protein
MMDRLNSGTIIELRTWARMRLPSLWQTQMRVWKKLAGARARQRPCGP